MRTWVGAQIFPSYVGTVYMRVDLGRRYVCMPQEFLDHTQIGATLHQMRGKAVAQRVRVQALYPHKPSVLFADVMHRLTSKPASALVEKDRFCGTRRSV